MEQVGTKNIHFQESGNQLLLQSGTHHYEIDHKKLPFRKIVLLNSSLVGYFLELDAGNLLVGISSPEYIFSEEIHQLMNEKKILNIGNEQKYEVEKILALKPDAIFTNYVASFGGTYDILKKNGIPVIFIDEYLEEKPLDKTKIIKIIGKLIGKEQQAAAKYAEIERNYNNYKNLAQKSAKKPKVLTNEMYGNQWFVAGGKSNLGQFLVDANAAYIFADNQDTKSVPKSFEEVFVKANNAEFWMNVGNHQSKKELLQINSQYAEMQVYKSGKIYTVSGKIQGSSNDYFERGTVRADEVLKDYIQIFHPEIFPNEALTYLKMLK